MLADVEPAFTVFYRMLPWDIERLTLRQFNAYMTYRNKSIEESNKQRS